MKITIEYLVDARTKDRNTLLDPDNVLTLTVRGDQTYLLLALILYLIDKSYLNADCMKCRFFLSVDLVESLLINTKSLGNCLHRRILNMFVFSFDYFHQYRQYNNNIFSALSPLLSANM